MEPVLCQRNVAGTTQVAFAVAQTLVGSLAEFRLGTLRDPRIIPNTDVENIGKVMSAGGQDYPEILSRGAMLAYLFPQDALTWTAICEVAKLLSTNKTISGEPIRGILDRLQVPRLSETVTQKVTELTINQAGGVATAALPFVEMIVKPLLTRCGSVVFTQAKQYAEQIAPLFAVVQNQANGQAA